MVGSRGRLCQHEANPGVLQLLGLGCLGPGRSRRLLSACCCWRGVWRGGLKGLPLDPYGRPGVRRG